MEHKLFIILYSILIIYGFYLVLKEKSDILIKLKARCEVCGKPAKYTYTNQESTQRAIARRAKFGTAREPRCKQCYDLLL